MHRLKDELKKELGFQTEDCFITGPRLMLFLSYADSEAKRFYDKNKDMELSDVAGEIADAYVLLIKLISLGINAGKYGCFEGIFDSLDSVFEEYSKLDGIPDDMDICIDRIVEAANSEVFYKNGMQYYAFILLARAYEMATVSSADKMERVLSALKKVQTCYYGGTDCSDIRNPLKDAALFEAERKRRLKTGKKPIPEKGIRYRIDDKGL